MMTVSVRVVSMATITIPPQSQQHHQEGTSRPNMTVAELPTHQQVT